MRCFRHVNVHSVVLLSGLALVAFGCSSQASPPSNEGLIAFGDPDDPTPGDGVTPAANGGSGSSVQPGNDPTLPGNESGPNPTGIAGGSNPSAQPGGPDGTENNVPDAEWWFNGPRTAPPRGSWPPPSITLTPVSTANQPTVITAPPGDPSRLFFAEKRGVIRVIKDGVLLPEPVLDMQATVLEGGPYGATGPEFVGQGKRGLVGLAFHPNYEENGRVFVMYTADQGIPGYGTVNYNNLFDDGDLTFAEFRRSADNPDRFDPAPVSVFLQFDKGSCDQCSQHNGGALQIGVDGFLWASTGDPPPYDNPGAADLNNLNGKLLRFDISGDAVLPAGNYPGADPYVASIGIRNAYKFSIDRYTGDVYVGDVGENSWEEISVERYGDGHKDHEFPKKEGFQSYMALSCDGENCLPPVFDYGHTGAEGTPGADNCIIGGQVYRGQAIPALQGTYIYADNGSGKVRAIQVENGQLVNGPHEFGNLSVFTSCFGENAAGEMFVCDYNGGRILRVDAQ
jgi:glucose/arabinose dehydrogenase